MMESLSKWKNFFFHSVDLLYFLCCAKLKYFSRPFLPAPCCRLSSFAKVELISEREEKTTTSRNNKTIEIGEKYHSIVPLSLHLDTIINFHPRYNFFSPKRLKVAHKFHFNFAKIFLS